MILAATLGAVLSAYAQTPVDTVQSWTDPGPSGWTNTPSVTTLSNPGGYLDMGFRAQSFPSGQADIMRVDVAPGILLTNISFSFLATNMSPSAVWLYIHSSRSNTWWYSPLSIPPQGEWTAYNVPVDFSLANWVIGPDSSRERFRLDMLHVDWVGVYVMRDTSIAAQDYCLDDFRMQGITIPASLSISGTVAYTGEQEGPIYVYAMDPNDPPGTPIVMITDPGAYQISGLTVGTDYLVGAYRDSDSNGVRQQWEASGSFVGNPLRLYVSDTNGVDITMSDGVTPDGLPYWWTWRYFGSLEPVGQGGGGQSFAFLDSDGDGLNNWGEYRAGTDPTNSASVFTIGMWRIENGEGDYRLIVYWDSIAKRTYNLWRSENLFDGFITIESGIQANPPINEYEDTNAVAGRQYFYRVEVK
jgi:hypothetical protein